MAFGWRGEDELILLDIEEKRQCIEQVGAAQSRIEGVREYIEGRPQGDGRMARAVRALLEVADPEPRPNPTHQHWRIGYVHGQLTNTAQKATRGFANFKIIVGTA
jgi:hypothetical protein